MMSNECSLTSTLAERTSELLPAHYTPRAVAAALDRLSSHSALRQRREKVAQRLTEDDASARACAAIMLCLSADNAGAAARDGG